MYVTQRGDRIAPRTVSFVMCSVSLVSRCFSVTPNVDVWLCDAINVMEYRLLLEVGVAYSRHIGYSSYDIRNITVIASDRRGCRSNHEPGVNGSKYQSHSRY